MTTSASDVPDIPIDTGEVVRVTISGRGAKGDWFGMYIGAVVFVATIHPEKYHIGDEVVLRVMYVGERFCRGYPV